MNSGDNEGKNCRTPYFTVCTVKFFSRALKILSTYLCSRFILRVYAPSYVPELCSEFILRIYSQNLCSEFIFKIYVPDLHSTFTFCVYSSRSWSYILKWTSSQQTPVYSAFLPRISSRRLRNHKILHSIWSTYHWLFC